MTRLVLAGALAAVVGAAAACTTTYEFDPVTVGGEDTAGEPRPTSSSQFIRAVYADLYGRTPEVYDFEIRSGGVLASAFPIDEQAQLVAAQDAVGDPTALRSRLVAGMVRAPEAAVPDKAAVDDPRAYVADEFRRLLGREPSAYELDRFVREWDSDPAVGPRAVIRALIGSREYQSQ